MARRIAWWRRRTILLVLALGLVVGNFVWWSMTVCSRVEESAAGPIRWTSVSHVVNITERFRRCTQNKRVAFVGGEDTYTQFVSLATILGMALPLRATPRSELSFGTTQNNVTITFFSSSFLLDANDDQRKRIVQKLFRHDATIVGVFDSWWGTNSAGRNTLEENRVRVWQMVMDVAPLLGHYAAVDRPVVWRSSTPSPCLDVTKHVEAQLNQLNMALLRVLASKIDAPLYLDVTSTTNEWVNSHHSQESVKNCSHWGIPGVPDVWNEMFLSVLCGEHTSILPVIPSTFSKSSPAVYAMAHYLLALEPPTLTYYGLSKFPGALEVLKRRRITLFMGMGTELRFPMDWTQYPKRSLTFRVKLLSLAPAMQAFGTIYLDPSKDASLRHKAANMAKLMCLDWIEHGPMEDAHMIRHDIVIGSRAGSLLFGLRIALAEQLLSDNELIKWLRSLKEHAAWLMNDAHYASHHNHGIFEDIGLFLLGRDLVMLPKASLWVRHSRKRCRENFAACIEWNEGIWLEHSSLYQLVMVRALRRILAIDFGSKELVRLERRMSENLSWFYLPDGKMVALGDTTPGPYHKNVGGPRDTVNDTLRVFWKTGLGIARAAPHSVFHFVSWFHSKGHKHFDDLSISLFDLGERLLVHPGVYGYVTGSDKYFDIYARSTAASNGLRVDSDLELTDREVFYGSGLVAAGWRVRSDSPPSFALEGWNPRIRRKRGVTHHRTIYYHPMHTLVIVDHVHATKPHLYTRYLHFGPAVTLRSTKGQRASFDMIIGGHNGTRIPRVVESSTGGIRTYKIRGRQTPPIQGFVFPTGMRPLVPVDTMIMSCTTKSATFVVWFDLEGTRAPHVRLNRVNINKKTAETKFVWTDGQRVILRRRESTFQIIESNVQEQTESESIDYQ